MGRVSRFPVVDEAALPTGVKSQPFARRAMEEAGAIVLPGAGTSEAVEVVERIRRALDRTTARGEAPAFTASFGIATYPLHAMSKEALIRQADAAMYRVKSTTKNAVGIAVVEDATRPLVP